MELPTKPFIVLYVVWHPKSKLGEELKLFIYNYFRRELFENVAGGAGLSVIYRSEALPDTKAPIPVDLDEGETSATVVLVDENFAGDENYLAWLQQVSDQTEARQFGARLFPVLLSNVFKSHKFAITEQALRWDQWQGMEHEARLQRLASRLTYQISRMLRSYLEHLKRPMADEDALDFYLKKVQVFLSHSKWDDDGERIAKAIRTKIFEDDAGLSSFFDVNDIPTGVHFDRVILRQVRVSAVVAIHTDSFSSREWCRKEIIEAKRAGVPLVIANCLNNRDERGFPYMGNVPIVRMDPQLVDKIDDIIGRLLDEVLKDFLWKCQLEIFRPQCSPDVHFLPRPPELISLAELKKTGQDIKLIIHPNPPLGEEERVLFEEISPGLSLRSLIDWIAEAGHAP